MADEELVDSIETVEDPSKLVEILANTSCIIRIFDDGKIAKPNRRQIKVYAENHYDSLSSFRRPKITRREKEKRIPLTFIEIFPAHENQELTFYWNQHNVKPSNEYIQGFGFGNRCGNLGIDSPTYRLAFNIYPSLSKAYQIEQLRTKVERAKTLNLSYFGLGEC